jgi:P4 family phage/plasmid primase-like protien
MLDWALRYIRMGWPVIPLRGKIPLTKNGSHDATLDEKQALEWWTKWAEANIGVATGHRFFALDVDIKGGGEESFDFLRHQHGAFPDTAEQITGTGGRHLLFLPPDFPVRNSTSAIAPGIDIRGVGGYIVVAPSIHPETKRAYDWDGLREIEEQPIAAAPAWLLDKLRAGPAAQIQAKPAPANISEGNRNTQLYKLACSQRRKGLSEFEILATLRASNQVRCSPPLPDAELETIAKSAARHAPDARALFVVGDRGDKSSKDARPDEQTNELRLKAVDVEAAIDDAITRNDLVGAIKLAPEVAILRPMMRAVVAVKLRQHFGREFPARDFDRAVKDAVGGEENPPAPPNAPPDAGQPLGGGPDLRWYPLTDAGNGERIAALFGADIRYCVEMRRWLVWDGKRWAVDDFNVIRQRAKQMARMLYLQSAGMTQLEKHARASESFAMGTAALGYAATEKGIPVSAADLDQQPYLLNCPNGVIDLRTMGLLPFDRGFLITKLCPVPFDPKAQAPRFQAFVEWAMGGGANPDAELSEHTVRLVGFLQRAFGYALTSDVSEKAIFVLHGEQGNNGKTTLLTLFRDLLGKDYSGQLSIDTVMTMKNQDATARADLADLRGTRLVVTSEVEKEHKLDEGKIKYITAGMGEIKSCRKYENPIEFKATHKLFMDCNHRPRVRGTDDAIWRRLKLVPFEITIPDEQKDLQLPDKLRTELPGILAWAVRGAMAWFKDGLGDPPEVGQAGIEWREHDDPLKEFLEDCCESGEDLFIHASELAAGYEWWAKQNRERYPLGREAFNERLLAKGYKQSRGRRNEQDKQFRAWEGIELKNEVTVALQKRSGQPSRWDGQE